AQGLVRRAGESAERFCKSSGGVAQRQKAGDIARSDVARIRVDALRAENDARIAQSDLQKARAALAYVIGAERDAGRIRAADSWPELAAAADAVEIDRALSGRADVQAASARIAAADKNRELARALRTRDITGSASFQHFPG